MSWTWNGVFLDQAFKEASCTSKVRFIKRKPKILIAVAPKIMVSKTASQYARTLFTGLSFFSEILNLTDCWLLASSQETALKPVTGTCYVYS